MFFTSHLRQPRRHQLDDIDMNADQLVAGILYHVIDERLATTVDETSVRGTVDRLRRQCARGTIRRRMWSAMTNVQRLTWLMLRAQTMLVIDTQGHARLRPMHVVRPPVLIAHGVRPADRS